MYSKKNIYDSLKKIGLKSGDNVLVKSDLRFSGPYENQNKLCEDLYKTISQIINLKKGTIFVSTSSTYLCNTSKIFDIKKTKSERGAFSNYILGLKKSIRSIHPYLSYTGIGKYAKNVCSRNSKHGYGPNSPKERMLKINTKYITIGLKPNQTCTFIHYVEMIMGVPYRYTKEFKSKIKINNKIKKENFYMYVNYFNTNLKRDHNKKLFKFCKKNGLKINETNLGDGKIYSYNCNEFVSNSINFLTKNIYGWCLKEPTIKHYTL
jgi:aminoglycoside 3-N-acetyltransferase